MTWGALERGPLTNLTRKRPNFPSTRAAVAAARSWIDFIELAVWRVLRLLASIADEFALILRRDFAVAAKRSSWAFVTSILRPGLHCRPCLAAILAQRDHRVPKAVRIAVYQLVRTLSAEPSGLILNWSTAFDRAPRAGIGQTRDGNASRCTGPSHTRSSISSAGRARAGRSSAGCRG